MMSNSKFVTVEVRSPTEINDKQCQRFCMKGGEGLVEAHVFCVPVCGSDRLEICKNISLADIVRDSSRINKDRIFEFIIISFFFRYAVGCIWIYGTRNRCMCHILCPVSVPDAGSRGYKAYGIVCSNSGNGGWTYYHFFRLSACGS